MEVRSVDPNATLLERFIEFMALPLIWAHGFIQTFYDFDFQHEPPPIKHKYKNIVKLPDEDRVPSWHQEKFLNKFKGEDDWDHNLEVFIEAMECQLQTTQGYSCELVRFLREVKKKLPFFADLLARTYIEIGHEPKANKTPKNGSIRLDQERENPINEDEKKVAEFYERVTLSTRNIYATAVYLQMDEDLQTFKAMKGNEQLQYLTNLIPITTRTDSWYRTCRVYTKVWYTVCQLNPMYDLLLGVQITAIFNNPSIKYSSATKYLEKGGDLLTLREAAIQLAQK